MPEVTRFSVPQAPAPASAGLARRTGGGGHPAARPAWQAAWACSLVGGA